MSGLRVEPACDGWALPEAPERSQARARMGIPENTTVVMTGHQAEAWHPGIAAKFYLARAVADRLAESGRPACVVWITPDQVDSQPFRLRAPVVRDGRLEALLLEMAPGGVAGSIVSARPAADQLKIDWKNTEPAMASIAGGAEAYRFALDANTGAGNAAKQGVGAMRDLLGDSARPDVLLYASELGGAGAMDRLIEAMLSDPDACIRAYNEAARAHPEAGIAELASNELPLWRLRDGLRRRVIADELADIPREEMAPRALAQTLIARRDLCEVFIHGTGGGVYDHVMEQWAHEWLGETELAPMGVATATYTLPIEHLAPDEAEINRAIWKAHSAQHDPSLLGDEAAAKEKRILVEKIEVLRQNNKDPSALYRDMHALLERVRDEQAETLAELEREAGDAAKRRGTRDLAEDRTWSLVLHGDSVKGELIKTAREAAAGLRTPARSPRG